MFGYCAVSRERETGDSFLFFIFPQFINSSMEGVSFSPKSIIMPKAREKSALLLPEIFLPYEIENHI